MRGDLHRAARTWRLLMRARGPDRLSPPPRSAPGRARGVALLLVMVSIAVLGALTGEFAYESRGAILAATNAEAEVHAFFHARSAMEISRLVVLAPKLLAGKFGPLLAMAKASGGQTSTPSPVAAGTSGRRSRCSSTAASCAPAAYGSPVRSPARPS